eukprot:1478752-Rhodomonas_salina.1
MPLPGCLRLRDRRRRSESAPLALHETRAAAEGGRAREGARGRKAGLGVRGREEPLPNKMSLP